MKISQCTTKYESKCPTNSVQWLSIGCELSRIKLILGHDTLSDNSISDKTILQFAMMRIKNQGKSPFRNLEFLKKKLNANLINICNFSKSKQC